MRGQKRHKIVGPTLPIGDTSAHASPRVRISRTTPNPYGPGPLVSPGPLVRAKGKGPSTRRPIIMWSPLLVNSPAH